MDYKVGDKVTYTNYGVCEITKIEQRPDFINPDQMNTYYTLVSLNERLGKAILPESRMDQVRYALTKRQAIELIETVPEIEIDEFFGKGRNVTEDHFIALIKSGDITKLLTVIKSMRARMQKQVAMGKNPSAAFMRIEREAKNKLNVELAYALDIQEKDVEDYMNNYLEKKFGKTE